MSNSNMNILKIPINTEMQTNILLPQFYKHYYQIINFGHYESVL